MFLAVRIADYTVGVVDMARSIGLAVTQVTLNLELLDYGGQVGIHSLRLSPRVGS